MAKPYFAARILCPLVVFVLAWQTSLSRADDPVEAEIASLSEKLFHHPELTLMAEQALERLIKLDELLTQRADTEQQHAQLLRQVRELVGYSNITDEKCRAGESIGSMLDIDAYHATSIALQPYWARQATLQLEHCLAKLNSACETELDDEKLKTFIELAESVKREQDQADLDAESQKVAMTEGVLKHLLSQSRRLHLLRTGSAFIGDFETALQVSKEVTRVIEPWVGIFRSYETAHGICVHDKRAITLARGVSLHHDLVDIRDDVYELYKPKGIRGRLNSWMLKWLSKIQAD